MDQDKVKLLIANDHSLYGSGLGNAILKKMDSRFLIQYTIDFESTLNYLIHNETDVVIIDYQMPKGDVFNTIDDIRVKCPKVKIILNGMFMKSSMQYFPTLLPKLDGLLSFVCTEDDYIKAIDTVLNDGIFFYFPGFKTT